MTINCPECGHPINNHDANGCWHDKFTLLDCMDCKQTPATIAAHAIEQAIAEAMEVIKPFGEYGEIFTKVDESDSAGLWVSSSITVGHLRHAAAWLAAHQPQERTEAEASMQARADQLEEELNDPSMTKEVGLPALDELARLYDKLEP